MTDVVRWMAEAPAKLAGIESSKGRIAAGFDADHCAAKVVSTSAPVEGSTAYN